jgi:hypothetical protein
MKKLRRRPVRLDRSIRAALIDAGILARGFRKSMRTLRRFRPLRSPRG